MESSRQTDEAGGGDAPSQSAVTVHSTNEDRVVFTEAGNTDGWIATDHTVSLNR